jgi:class 3 adenylate cyclase
MFLVAALATVVVTRLVSSSLEQRFANQLLDAGKSVNDDVLKVEQEQVELLRLMTNAQGVPAAIKRSDSTFLQQALIPLQVNSGYDLVDVVDLTGSEVLAIRPPSGPLAAAFDDSIGQWEIVRQTLQGASDDFGDKYSDLVSASYGYVFYTASPVRAEDGTVAGSILVGLPGDQLLQRLTKDTLASVSLYDAKGKLLQTTLPGQDPSLNLSTDRYLQQVAEGNVTERSIKAAGKEYMELVGGLVVRDKVAAGLGVALPTDYITSSSQRTRLLLIVLFSTVVVLVIIVALTLARRLTGPILTLVQACMRVARGSLDEHVTVNTSDETRVLADSFNDMIIGLRDRAFVREAFGKYMSAQVSEAILSGDLKLGGERRLVTLLMSDIRSFTTLSETMRPEDLVAFLNRYFETMVECIVQNEGVVDKYMGDAILAVYGAPILNEQHARCAALTALQMREHLRRFNEELLAEGHQPIRIGIGINTGEVIAGNIGSEVRMEYTVIGDTVNATQRIEDLTKEVHTDILISETSLALLDDAFIVGPAHKTVLRGRSQETLIYPLIDLKGGLVEALADAGPEVREQASAELSQELIDRLLQEAQAKT